MQYLKIPNKVSEYIVQIVLKGCVIVSYGTLGFHFHALRRCKELTEGKNQSKIFKRWDKYITNLKEVD